MGENTVIKTINNITLVTLQNCPADLTEITAILENISKIGVNIDMLSMASTHASLTDFSFTVDDDDLFKCLSALHGKINAKFIVSNGNHKISVCDPDMKNTPGIAFKVFQAAASVHTDIRLVSTSEIEISMLVTSADYERTLEAVHRAMEL